MTISRSFDHPATTVGKAVVTAGLGMALLFVGTTGQFAPPVSTTAAATPSVPTMPRVARASRSAVRASLPVAVPVDLPWELEGRAEAQSMADSVAAQIEAQRVAAEQAAAAAAAQVVAEQAAVEQAAVEQAAAQVAAAQATRARATAATVKTSAKSSPTTVAAPAPASVRDFASSLVGGGEQFTCLDQLFQKESGWDAAATNRSSGAFGIPQALPGSKMASAGADWATNPNTQVLWGVGYVNGRYGSACAAWAAWQAKGWY